MRPGTERFIHYYLIEKVTPNKLTFLSAPIASKQSAFPLTEVSAFEVPAILKKFVSKEASSGAAILKLYCQPSRVYVTSFSPNWEEINMQLTEHISQDQQSPFFQAIIVVSE